MQRITALNGFEFVVSETLTSGRSRWSRHADFTILRNGMYEVSGPPVFSVEGMRGQLKLLLGEQLKQLDTSLHVINGDIARQIEDAVAVIGLPVPLTRADRILASGRQDTETLIEHLFGDSEPEQPARIEMCGDSDHAHLYAYDEMPLESVKVPSLLKLIGFPSELVPSVRVTSKREAYDAIDRGVEQGVYSDEDRVRLRVEVATLPLIEAREETPAAEREPERPVPADLEALLKEHSLPDGLADLIRSAARRPGADVRVIHIKG